MTRWFAIALTGAVVIAVGLFIVTGVFSVLAAIHAASGPCVGRFMVAGYRTQIPDFLAFPALSAVGAGVIIAARTHVDIRAALATYDLIVFAFRAFRVTY